MSKVISYLKLIRPVNVLITILSSIVGSILCLKIPFAGFYSPGNTFAANILSISIMMAALAAGLTAASGNVINDFIDSEGDKINHPERPIPSGRLTKNQAIVFYFVLTSVSLIITASISIPLAIINAFAVILLLIYSIKLKKIILAGNIAVSLLTGLVFIYGGAVIGEYYLSLIPAAFAFLINMIREIVKDIQDIEGDTGQGIITFPAKFGIHMTKNFILFLCAMLFAAALLPLAFNIYGKSYGYIILFSFEPVLVYIIVLLCKKDNNLILKNISFLLKLNMIIGLTALYFGR